MMQCIFLMCLMTVIWALYGYSLVFGGDQSDVDRKLQLRAHARSQCGVDDSGTASEHGAAYDALADDAHGLSGHVLHHYPALICGAFAERMKFSTMVVFMVLWGTFVYCPLAHWLWGSGGVLGLTGDPSKSLMGGAIDFAGGTVVHISSGVSALICALMLGKRLGYGKEEMRPHNMTYTAIGAAMLWVGWFGFNAGSALSGGGLATLRLCRHASCRGLGRNHLGGLGMVLARQTERAGRLFGACCRTGHDHSGGRFRHTGIRPADRRDRSRGLLYDLHRSEGLLRLR